MAGRLRENLERCFLWFFMAMVFNSLDIILTAYAVQDGHTEANPFARPVVLTTWYIIVKQAAVPALAAAGAAVLPTTWARVFMKALTFAFGSVVVSNACNLAFGWSLGLGDVVSSGVKWYGFTVITTAVCGGLAWLHEYIVHTPADRRLIALE